MKTKLPYLLIVMLMFSIPALAQKAKESKEKEYQIISSTARVDRFHTIDDLTAMGKAELIKLYHERFQVVILLLPYSALSATPGATLESLGIPPTNENKNLLKEEGESSQHFYETVENSLNNFIAYADKANIIWSIILFEDIIKKVNLGKEF